MIPQLSQELTQYVQDQLDSAQYDSEEDLLVDAIRIHRELSQRHKQLREDIQAGIASLDAGEGKPHSMDDVKARVADRFNSKST